MKRKSSTPASGSFESKKPSRMTVDIDYPKLIIIAGAIFGISFMTIVFGKMLHDSNVSPAGIALFTTLAIAIFTIVITLWIRNNNRVHRRQNEIAKWAESKGLKFRFTKDLGIGSRYGLFKCMRWGTECYACNIMEGTFANRQICAFDYYSYKKEKDPQYLTISDNFAGSHILSTVIVEAGLKLKPLFIRPESFIDRIAESAGLDDINLESAEFNKQFHVKSADHRWAYDVLNQSTIELLLNSPRFIIELQDHQIMAYRKDKLSAVDFEEALQLITGILDRLPESVVQELKGQQ